MLIWIFELIWKKPDVNIRPRYTYLKRNLTYAKKLITCKWQNDYLMSNKSLLSIMSKVIDKKNELWKTGGLTNFQKPQLQSVSSSSEFCLFLFAVIYTFFSCFEGLFSCLTNKFGGSYHCLKFNKCCGTAPLNLQTYVKSFFLFIKLNIGWLSTETVANIAGWWQLILHQRVTNPAFEISHQIA